MGAILLSNFGIELFYVLTILTKVLLWQKVIALKVFKEAMAI